MSDHTEADLTDRKHAASRALHWAQQADLCHDCARQAQQQWQDEVEAPSTRTGVGRRMQQYENVRDKALKDRSEAMDMAAMWTAVAAVQPG
jgi:hypothetical protein